VRGADVPGRHEAEPPDSGQKTREQEFKERERALLAEVQAETPEESVRNLLYKTMFVVSEIRSIPPGPEDLVADANRNPRVQKLLQIMREGTDPQRHAIRDAILKMLHVYLTELPESSPARVAWQPSVGHPGGGVAYFYLLSHLNVDPISTLKLLVDVHLREQAAYRHYSESSRPPGHQERPRQIVMTEQGQFLAMAADQLLATIRSREDLQKGLTQPQLDLLHRFERQRQTVASEGDDELRILKDATEFVYPGGVPDSARPATRSASPPATQPQADTALSALDLARKEEWREERPWVVEGRVTDEKNQPLAGVKVVVRCGLGALRITGETTSGPDGRYTLRFQPGTWSHQNVGDWQHAKVAASKDGFANRDESRKADLWMAPRPLTGGYVGLPPDKMVLPNRPYRLDFVMTAVPVDGSAENVPWGKAEGGVQLRIRPVQRVWRAGEQPAFKIEARNTGEFDLHLPENGTYAQVEIDGRWYAWDVDLAISIKAGGRGTKLLDLPPGGSLRDLAVVLGDGWQAIKHEEVETLAFRGDSEGFIVASQDMARPRLSLTPGKHTVRVAHVAQWASVWVRDELYRIGRKHAAIRAVSNPVEIEILPAGSTNTATQPATRPAAGGTRDAGKVPESFITKTRKGEDTKQTATTPTCLKPFLSSTFRAFTFSCFRDPGLTPARRWHQPCACIHHSDIIRSRLSEHDAGSLSGTLVPVWKGQVEHAFT